MNNTPAARKRRTRAERNAHYCAICEPDANEKQGTDHRTDQHDDRGTWLG